MQQHVVVPAPETEKWGDCFFCLSRETMREDVIKQTNKRGGRNRFSGMPYWQCDSCKMTLFVNRKRGHLGVELFKHILKNISGPELRYLVDVAQDAVGASAVYKSAADQFIGGLRNIAETAKTPEGSPVNSNV
ncbi:MAG: YgiT-type zinc finger protein [Planctomycetes bacterium]|nr:YgiT-type zinc finger protein [Planctomycetota bacterium]